MSTNSKQLTEQLSEEHSFICEVLKSESNAIEAVVSTLSSSQTVA